MLRRYELLRFRIKVKVGLILFWRTKDLVGLVWSSHFLGPRDARARRIRWHMSSDMNSSMSSDTSSTHEFGSNKVHVTQNDSFLFLRNRKSLFCWESSFEQLNILFWYLDRMLIIHFIQFLTDIFSHLRSCSHQHILYMSK